MKKQDVIEAMRKTALSAHLINSNPIGYSDDRMTLFGELLALRSIASRLFHGEEVYEEFEFYPENYDTPFPQPEVMSHN
ncbi:hypothetical protein [Trichlorobacter thiogenes]|uniref:hypothetical protein n=1 Tax=Trichlorobacter thiogenes TaxID=115783 RepID=UPI001115F1DA|nr:hypothetical protein [Trichlorobacter thiogenes]